MKRLPLLLPLLPQTAHAVAAAVTGTALDSLIPTWSVFIVGTLIPFTILIIILAFAWKAIIGHHFSQFAVRLGIACVVLALGLAGVSRMMGGTIVTSFIS